MREERDIESRSDMMERYNKMSEDTWDWDSKTAKMISNKPGTTADGVITMIVEGTVDTFIPKDKIKGDKKQLGFNAHVEGKDADGVKFTCDKFFSIRGLDDNGIAFYSENSNINSFKKINGVVPQAGVVTKCSVNKDGYWRIVTE